MRDINNNYDDFMAFLGDAFEPVARIAADPEVAEIFRGNKPKILLVKALCTRHSGEVAEIIAALKGESAEGFKGNFNALEMMKNVTELIQSPAVTQLFRSAEQKTGAASSGSAAENVVPEA